MTEAEKNEIVGLVMTEISSQAVDFDITTEQPQANDLLTAVREVAGRYVGVTLKWDDVARIATELANQAATRAEQAKTNVENMKSSVEQTVTDFNALAEEKKQEVQGVYQSDLNELKGDLTFTINKVKQELDDKKITKFYASNNGNTNLPDSDNGKPTDMFIYGKSVQDGTPTPDNPIEIQSVVNPTVTVCGKNLANPNKYIYRQYINTEGGLILENKDGWVLTDYIKNTNKNYFVSGVTVPNSIRYRTLDKNFNIISFKTENLGYNQSFTFDDCEYFQIGFRLDYIDTFMIEFGSQATEYEPYKEQKATLPYTLNAIPVSEGGNVTIDGQQYVADYVDVERKKLVRVIGYGNPFENYHWNLNSNDNYWYCDSSEYIQTKNFIKIPQDNNSNVHSLWKDGIIATEYKFYNGKVSEEKAFGVGISGIVFYKNTSVTSTSYNGCKGTFIKERFYYELPTPTETDLTDAEIEAFKALETYYPVTNVSVTSDQLDGHAVFNYPLNMANGWNYVMQQIGETRPIIYDTQVKTIENLIDTAILTAMMEA